eukprot:gene24807-33287_t
MGGSIVKYKPNAIISSREIQCPEWLADSAKQMGQIKKENFDTSIPIGKGKFGLVFIGKHLNGNKHVAIKYIPKQIIFETQSSTRIQQEFDIVEKLDHPFIIHCFGGFETSAAFALVFEFAFGGELYNRMKTVHTMAESVAKFYFCEIALALHYLHDEKKIVYRDIKPENILIDYRGHVKLCDFGFAVAMKESASTSPCPSPTPPSDQLQDGCGTAMYVAPEIAEGFTRGSHSFPVDWWGLGCVLMEMVTGDAPFGDSETMSKFEIFNNINHKSVRFPLLMSMELKSLLKGLLDKNPAKRMGWAQVSWEDMLKQNIQPPWIPKIPNRVTSENFVKWDLDTPSGHSPPKVSSYCSSIKVPRSRKGRENDGGLNDSVITDTDDVAGFDDATNSPKKPRMSRKQLSSRVHVTNNAWGEDSSEKNPTLSRGQLSRRKSLLT